MDSSGSVQVKLTGQIEQYENLADFIRDECRDFGFKSAFSNMGGTLSYAEVDLYADQFSAYLQHCTSLKPGDRIAVQLPNLLQYPVVAYGALRAGLVLVNTNPLYTVEETIHQFCDAGVKAVVVLANSAAMLEQVLPKTDVEHVIVTQLADLHSLPKRLRINLTARYLRKIVPPYSLPNSVSFRSALKEGRRYPFTTVPRRSDQIALIQYTVGTTGAPKGVVLSHRNLIANAVQLRYRLSRVCENGEEIAIAPLPLFHIYAFTLNCLVLATMGAQIVLITNPRDIQGFVNELGRWKYTFFSGLNTLFVSLCQSDAFCQLDHSQLKYTIAGGMALTRSCSDMWRKITGSRMIQGYGLTEAAPVVAVADPNLDQCGSVGYPLPLTEVKVVGEQGENLCSGESGELYVRGPQVMKRYWNEERRDPDGQGWLATGDMARITEDGIHIIDRKQDIINISGFPVFPNELENTITGHPDILECAVIGLPDEQQSTVIKLFIVSSNPRLSVKEVRDYCRERLTSYKVPKQVEFRSYLPKSNVGKVLRRTLLDEELKRLHKLRKHL